MDQLFMDTGNPGTADSNTVMAALIGSKDWSKTHLGAQEQWPYSLRVALDLILHSRYPMFIWWGPDLIMFHNDAYLPVLGHKHPAALGKSAREIWAEIWPDIGQIVENVFKGESFYAKDLLLFLERKGFSEETYWTFSYSPFLNDTGTVGGLFCACNEETRKILRQRRLNIINHVAALSSQYKDIDSICKATMTVLESNPQDIPFSALYIKVKGSGSFKRLATSCATDLELLFPEELTLTAQPGLQKWDLDVIEKTGKTSIVQDIGVKLPRFSQQEETIQAAALIPLLKPGQQELAGVLICGVSSFLEFDEEYQNFLELTAAQISAAVADLQILEAERQRAKALEEIATMRNRARLEEKALREQLSNIFGQSPAAIAILEGPQLRFSLVNPKCEELIGYGEAELIGKSPEEVFPNLISSKSLRIIHEAYDKGLAYTREEYPLEVPGLSGQDSRVAYFHLVVQPVKNSLGKVESVMVHATNVAELVQARNQLREKEEKLRLALESTNLGTWDYYPLIDLLQWSDICKEIFGIPIPEEITYEKFLDRLHPDDRQRTDASVREALENHKHYDIEYRIIRLDDQEERWIRAAGNTYVNETGEAIRLVGIAQDITDRKMAEQQKDDFLRIAGHELRTPLTSIAGYLGLIKRFTGKDEKLEEYVERSLQSTIKMRTLISDFLDISKVERGEISFEMERIDFSLLMKETVESLQLSFPGHPIHLALEEQVYLSADKNRLEQVIVNLVNNAVKYSSKRQAIEISLITKKQKALLRIQDQGIGMEEKEISKIFSKFYRVTAGNKIKGMGLGLYIVKKIIDFHGGTIHVESIPNQGTIFIIGLDLD